MNKIKVLIMLFFCSFSVFLVIKGQRIDGYFGLSIMLVGIFGLLIELYLYNRKYD